MEYELDEASHAIGSLKPIRLAMAYEQSQVDSSAEIRTCWCEQYNTDGILRIQQSQQLGEFMQHLLWHQNKHQWDFHFILHWFLKKIYRPPINISLLNDQQPISMNIYLQFQSKYWNSNIFCSSTTICLFHVSFSGFQQPSLHVINSKININSYNIKLIWNDSINTNLNLTRKW